MQKNKSIGTEEFKIASYQMDEKGNATLTSLAGLFQEMAGNHADANHVNNVMYTRILLDSYSYDWRKSKVPKSFEINN